MPETPVPAEGWGFAGARSQFIGRTEELRELADLAEQVRQDGIPRAVTIVGNPGIGKSRLLGEFLLQLRERDAPVRAFRGHCHEQGTAFSVFSRLLRGRFGIIDGIDPEHLRERFRDQVAEVLGDRRVTEFLHFLGAFLDLKFPDSPFTRALEEDPREFQKVTRTVLRRFLEVDAGRSPLVLAFEDIHWAHDESLELVRYLIQELRGAPILLLCVARPDLMVRRGDWFEGTGKHTRMELGPLSEPESAEMMHTLLARAGTPPADLVEDACEMARGNPYFLEQMIRIFLENGTLVEREDGSWGVNLDKLDEAELPLSVDEAIQARIGALSRTERTLLEQATTMGSVFWLGALVSIGRAHMDPPALWGGVDDDDLRIREVLHGLADRDYLLRLPDSTIRDDEEHAFKHNLEREMIHRLAPQDARKKNHLVLAQWLEHRVGERGEEQLELLGSHYDHGGARFQAARCYLQAGDKARRRYANSKAAEFYGKGLDLLGEDDAVTRIDTLHNLGDVSSLVGQYDRAIAAFRKMLVLAYRLDLKAKGGAAHNRIGRVHRDLGALDEAMRHLGTGHVLFESVGDLRGIASSLDDIGKVHWLRGNYDQALTFFRKALSIREGLADERSLALSLNNIGLVHLDSGLFRDALDYFQRALALRRKISDLPGVVASLNNLGTVYQDNREFDRAVELWQEALEIARDIGDRKRQAYLLTNIGEAKYRAGRADEAVRILHQAAEVAEQLGDRLLLGECARGLAKAYMIGGDIGRARDAITKSLEHFEALKSPVHVAIALRTAAEVTAYGSWGGDEGSQARTHFERSIQILESVGAGIELGRSCKAYSDFLEKRGETERAAHLRQRSGEIFERLKVSALQADLDHIPELDESLVTAEG